MTLSPQQGLDCLAQSTTPGDIFQSFLKQGGLATRADYPDSPDIGECNFTYAMEGIQILGDYGYMRIEPGDEESLRKAVRQ